VKHPVTWLMAPAAIAGFVISAFGLYLLLAVAGSSVGVLDVRYPASAWKYGALLLILGGLYLYLLFGGMERFVRWCSQRESNERVTRATWIRARARRNSLVALRQEFGESKEPKTL
jgi:hypothetical protein